MKTVGTLRSLAVTAATFVVVGMGSAHAQAVIGFSVKVAPPPIQVEVAPVARVGYQWVPGHWQWRPALGQYVWVRGRQVAVRTGYVYAAPRWVQVGGQWEYRNGGYIPEASWKRGVRDIDRDGIPDRWDADKDGAGVRNSRDRDRDGDGIRNRNDRNPDNRNRP